MLLISPNVREKLKQPDHNVTQTEIEECFANRGLKECTDTRAWHATNPPTRWFVSETDRGRRLKICYILLPDGTVEIKTAYPATAEIERIFAKYAA